MEPVRVIDGGVSVLNRNDVDTDQIIPKQFLKRIDRAGFGPFLFHSWRYDDDGAARPDFPMNRSEHAGATILVTGSNFGCGSSREHAVWALEDAGFAAIVAPSFADIFATNCAKVGVLTVTLTADEVRRLLDRVAADPALHVTIDLPAQAVHTDGFDATFEVDPGLKERLLLGLDDIELTLHHADAISAYEATRPAWLPSAR